MAVSDSQCFYLLWYCYIDYVMLIMLGAMTSLQQPITGKISTSLAGIQPIMNKLLTEISNSSTINPSDLTVSTSNSSSSSTSSSSSSSSDVVKVELNNSVASLNSSGATTRAAEMNTGMNTGVNTGINAGMNTAINAGVNAGGIGPGTMSGVSSSSTFSGPQSRLTINMNPVMSSSMNLPGMNHPGMSSGVNTVMNTGLNSGMNIGMGSGMNSGMGPGMNSGLGMQPLGMSSTNQIPPLPSANLTGMQHQTPDVYTSVGVGGAPGPPMMNQNAQTQVFHYKSKFTFT